MSYNQKTLHLSHCCQALWEVEPLVGLGGYGTSTVKNMGERPTSKHLLT